MIYVDYCMWMCNLRMISNVVERFDEICVRVYYVDLKWSVFCIFGRLNELVVMIIICIFGG